MISAPCRSTMTSTVWFRNQKVFGNLVSRSTGLREKSDRLPPMSWFTYPMAISSLLFGDSEWAMRLPSLIMGTLCIGIVALMGRRLFNWRTGLIAALIYACLPMNIRWAQNAFYPQQCQFMAMLTFWFFYEGIRVRPFHHKISDRSGRHLLRSLSVMGGKCIHSPRFVPCLARCALGRMVVAKGMASLPLRVLYGCLGDRAALLAHTRFGSIFADRLRAFPISPVLRSFFYSMAGSQCTTSTSCCCRRTMSSSPS